jgi:hypothetical protein
MLLSAVLLQAVCSLRLPERGNLLYDAKQFFNVVYGCAKIQWLPSADFMLARAPLSARFGATAQSMEPAALLLCYF